MTNGVLRQVKYNMKFVVGGGFWDIWWNPQEREYSDLDLCLAFRRGVTLSVEKTVYRDGWLAVDCGY